MPLHPDQFGIFPQVFRNPGLCYQQNSPSHTLKFRPPLKLRSDIFSPLNAGQYLSSDLPGHHTPVRLGTNSLSCVFNCPLTFFQVTLTSLQMCIISFPLPKRPLKFWAFDYKAASSPPCSIYWKFGGSWLLALCQCQPINRWAKDSGVVRGFRLLTAGGFPTAARKRISYKATFQNSESVVFTSLWVGSLSLVLNASWEWGWGHWDPLISERGPHQSLSWAWGGIPVCTPKPLRFNFRLWISFWLYSVCDPKLASPSLQLLACKSDGGLFSPMGSLRALGSCRLGALNERTPQNRQVLP